MVESNPSTPETIDQYRLGRRLGSGATGQVFEAIDRRNDTPVAVKLLWPAVTGGSSFRSRFQKEIAVAYTLRSPHIARVIDSGYSAGWYYVVMEHVDGESLASRLQRGPVAPGDAASIAFDVARALDYAAGQHVTHGDLKPENILLMQSGEARLTDFGVARLLEGVDAAATDSVASTLAYAAPETDAGTTAEDGRSDQYALGAILFHLLTGHPPFEGTPLQVRQAHAQQPTPLEALAGAPPELAAIVARCMAKAPAMRFTSARELADALAPQSYTLARKEAAEDLSETLAEAAGVPIPALATLANGAPPPEALPPPPTPPVEFSPQPLAAPAAPPPPSRDPLQAPPPPPRPKRSSRDPFLSPPPPPPISASRGLSMAGAAAMRTPIVIGAITVVAAVVAAAAILLVTATAFGSVVLLGRQLALDLDTATLSEVLQRDDDTDVVLGLQIFAALLSWPALAWFGWMFTSPLRRRGGGNLLTRTAGAWSWLIPLANAIYPFILLDKAARERGIAGGYRTLIWIWCIATVGGYGAWVTVLGLDPDAVEAASSARGNVKAQVVLQAAVGVLSVFAALCPPILALLPRSEAKREPA